MCCRAMLYSRLKFPLRIKLFTITRNLFSRPQYIDYTNALLESFTAGRKQF